MSDYGKIFVYRQNDLERDKENAETTARLYSDFFIYLRVKADVNGLAHVRLPEPEQREVRKLHATMLAQLASKLPDS